jgi:hypothetical protein|tara:strand:- start:1040 stop:1753 length:714 start_codon:yes stop_codon:yes gene_type:complete
MAVKSKSHEKLSFDNIEKVVGLLEQDSPITKKEACEILNIRYNTTRLQKIIEEHNDTKRFRETRKNQNKGKAASRDEIRSVVQYYLDGENISAIANSIYRSPAFVKGIIERLGVPQKLADSDYEGMKKAMLPEQCVAEEFDYNEKVWYPRKNKFAIVKAEITQLYQSQRKGYTCYGNITKCINYEDKYGAKCYNVWVLEPCDTSQTLFPWVDGSKTGFHSSALAYELGSLQHLKEYL